MNVLRLSDYRKEQLPQPPTAPRYFCAACNAETFRILQSHDVICVGCNRRITTIRAVRT